MVARPALLLALVGLLVIALVLVTLLAGGRRPAPPFGLARPGLITIDTADGIQLARLDGTERHVLVPADGQSLSPTWSRDRLHVAFWHRAANPGPWQLEVVDADGGDRQVVAGGVNLEERESTLNQPSSISWSPDSRRMAYAADVAGGSAIFVVDRDVYGPTRITDPALKAVDPAWSPDGAGSPSKAPRRSGSRWSIPMAAASDRFDELGETTLWPDWSPDGALLAVSVWVPPRSRRRTGRWRPTGRARGTCRAIPRPTCRPRGRPTGRASHGRAHPPTEFRSRVRGRGQPRRRARGDDPGPADLAPPTWSPDGTRLYRYVADEQTNFYEVVVLDPEGIAPPVK